MAITYTAASRFAWYISRGVDHKDLVHDAWVQFYTSTGEDMLTVPNYVALECIRNAYKRRFRLNFHIKDGELVRPQLSTFNDEFDFLEQTLPDSEIISKEQELIDKLVFDATIAELKRKVQTVHKKIPITIVDRMSEPSTIIAEDTGKSETVISYYKQRIRTIAKSMREYQPHNPFAASKITVVKVVKRETYDKNPEKYSEFKSTHEQSDYNEWYTLNVNDTNEGLLIKEPQK